jgi:hypothetical protein
MANCNASRLRFASLKPREIEAEFSGGEVSSDGGVLLVRQLGRRLGRLDRVASVLTARTTLRA